MKLDMLSLIFLEFFKGRDVTKNQIRFVALSMARYGLLEKVDNKGNTRITIKAEVEYLENYYPYRRFVC